MPSFIHGLGSASPLGVLFIVIDRLAGWFVARHYVGLPTAIVDAAGNLIRPMNPQIPMGRIERPPIYTGRLGLPENELDRLLQSAGVTAMQGVPQRKVFEWVNGFHGCTIRIIARGVSHPDSKVKEVISNCTKAGLTVVIDDCVYLPVGAESPPPPGPPAPQRRAWTFCSLDVRRPYPPAA